jgi:hypothetical protein
MKRVTPFLEKIPGVKQLFDTKYVGNLAREGAIIGGEVAAATTIPAAMQGRLPTEEDIGKASVLFLGMRSAQLPGQLWANIKSTSTPNYKYALADRIQELDLAYPALEEFKEGKNPIYKNSAALDQNLTAFDKSYIGNIVSKINNISPLEFSSAHEAGTMLKERIKPPPPLPNLNIVTTTPPEKPVERPVPLVQNPLREAVNTISGERAPTKSEIGRRVSEAYEVSRQQEYGPLQERYDNLEGSVEGFVFDDTEHNIIDPIEAFIAEFGGGAIPGSQEANVTTQATRLRNLFVQYDENGNVAAYTTVPLRRLISMNRSIKRLPNWELPPEMKDRLNVVTRIVDNYIHEELTQVFPEAADEYLNLNRDYALFKNKFDNSDMTVFYSRTEKSEAIANKFSKIDQFTQLQQALSDTPVGHRALNLLRREVWEDRIGQKVLNARREYG